MKICNHILGFPRIGLHRELKKALESYWEGKINKEKLRTVGYEIRIRYWKLQQKSGIDFVPVGDFSWYDHVLTTSLLLGNVPIRHKNKNDSIEIDTIFRIGRGKAPTGEPGTASEMTKWFNTNYHYIVPEFIKGQQFQRKWMQLLEEVDEALALGHTIKPILLGPVTYLWLGKVKGEKFNRISLLKDILPIYQQVLVELEKRSVQWVQIEEPVLVLELQKNWLYALKYAYNIIKGKVKLLLTTYFDSIHHNLETIRMLPVQGLHIDVVSGNDDILFLNKYLKKEWCLSIGVMNGRNVWRSDLQNFFHFLQPLVGTRNIWVSTSCSLLHSPIDLITEFLIEEEVKNWFSFSLQKCMELSLLSTALNGLDKKSELDVYSTSILEHRQSLRVKNYKVKKRLAAIEWKDIKRCSDYSNRKIAQKKIFPLSLFPTTTIGSFPQTSEIRRLRWDWKNCILNNSNYYTKIKKHIKQILFEQEILGLDVLVHGEVERNDMVEYFGENLDGFIFTKNGWVQSYGSRCVKPPIIIGDISRPESITIEFANFSNSITNKPVKGMLTGPITILFWSFTREDISSELISQQIALALRDEVKDLENSGIFIIQIDEPALREGLPLRKSSWKYYLKWAVNSFKLNASVVQDETQIHTHMCYCEFNDIIDSIAALDADVITIETSRSDMDLLDVFKNFSYPNDIGPGVYDIHTPNVPSVEYMKYLLKKASKKFKYERIWVNPDCGLKTRKWLETRKALTNMVLAANFLREEN